MIIPRHRKKSPFIYYTKVHSNEQVGSRVGDMAFSADAEMGARKNDQWRAPALPQRVHIGIMENVRP
jgi:hypothetical protein